VRAGRNVDELVRVTVEAEGVTPIEPGELPTAAQRLAAGEHEAWWSVCVVGASVVIGHFCTAPPALDASVKVQRPT
jgi:hypothetical protein